MSVVLEDKDKLVLGGLFFSLFAVLGLIITSTKKTLRDKFPDLFKEYANKFKLKERHIIDHYVTREEFYEIIPKVEGTELEFMPGTKEDGYLINIYKDEILPSAIYFGFLKENPNIVWLFDADIKFPSEIQAWNFIEEVEKVLGKVTPFERAVHPHIEREVPEYHAHLHYKDLDEEKVRFLLEKCLSLAPHY